MLNRSFGCAKKKKIEIKEESKEKNNDRRDEKGKETKGEGQAWGTHQTLGEPVWLTRSKVVNPQKGDKNKEKKGGQVSQYG